MNSAWRQTRKLIFITIIIFIILGFSSYLIYPYFNKPATCFDNKENGDEKGVDCGGSCKLVCTTNVIPLNVKTTKAVFISDGIYDLVALIENRNEDKNTQDGSIDYIFDIYDKSGSIIKTISGSTTIPLGQTFPIIIQNVPIVISGSNDITKVVFTIIDNKSWIEADSTYASIFFKVTNTDFKQNLNNISQLKISVKNLSRAYFRNVPVKVLLYDSNNNIIATNETLLKEISGASSKDLFFTWRIPLNIEDPKIEVYSVVTPYTYIK